jgi:hypothetical protein
MTELLKLLGTERGIAVLFAVALMAVLLGWLPSPLFTVATSATAVLTENAQLLAAHTRETTEQVRLLRIICRGMARDPSQCEPRRWNGGAGGP